MERRAAIQTSRDNSCWSNQKLEAFLHNTEPHKAGPFQQPPDDSGKIPSIGKTHAEDHQAGSDEDDKHQDGIVHGGRLPPEEG